MRTVIECFLILISLQLPFVAQASAQDKTLERSERSPSGKIIVEHYENYKADDYHFREVWLVSKDNPKDRYLLFTHGRSVEVIFAPNEELLVINDYLGSNASDIRLYRKTEGIKFAEIENAMVHKKAWGLLIKDYPVLTKLDFGHSYIKADMWSGNSDSILLSLWGHADTAYKGKYYSLVESWHCIFDLKTLSVSLDLRTMNRDLVSPH
jgi:hypothetical protein